MCFEESSPLQRSEVHGPDTIIDFFASDICAGAGHGDVDPAAIPADAAIGADIPDLNHAEGGVDQHRIGQQTQTTRPVHDLIIIARAKQALVRFPDEITFRMMWRADR
jgi:hypothetical protein